jgi:hypothetical protein
VIYLGTGAQEKPGCLEPAIACGIVQRRKATLSSDELGV